jgi:hypothetical protein
VFSELAQKLFWKLFSEHTVSVAGAFAGCNSCVPNDFAGYGYCVPDEFSGRVGEWLKPADCKSAAPCGLRRFESSPVHQALAVRRKPQGNRIKRCSEAVRFAVKALLGKSASRRTIVGGTGSAWVAQLVERVLGKDEVTGSIPVPGSSLYRVR